MGIMALIVLLTLLFGSVLTAIAWLIRESDSAWFLHRMKELMEDDPTDTE